MKLKIYQNGRFDKKQTSKVYAHYYLRQLGRRIDDWCYRIDRARGLV